ncbi:MAG: hypothetical protein MI924_03995 [Chloroflexales bacterium]|nr:hypothetical protein [Chloroflexales bacterium]
MRKHEPDQRDRPAAERGADHQGVWPMRQHHAIQQQTHALSGQSAQGVLDHGREMDRRVNAGVIAQAADTLFFACLIGLQRHGAGHGPLGRRPADGNPRQHPGQGLDRARRRIRQPGRQRGGRAIIQGAVGMAALLWVIRFWHPVSYQRMASCLPP